MGREEIVRKRLESTSKKYWNVPPEVGEFLKLMAEMKGAKNILEIGTSNGYSGLYLGAVAKRNKGRFTTIEGDWERAKLARANFIEAGIMKSSEIIIGEARELTKRLKGQFDFVFIDANKTQYLEYIKNIEKKNLRKGAVIIADNILSHDESVKKYVTYMNKHYRSTVLPIGGGEMVSIKE